MTRTARQSTAALRHIWLTLATLAIVLKVLVPAGFMVGAPTGDLPFALVLCTEAAVSAPDEMHGAHGEHGDHDQAPAKSQHSAPCVFAGHGLGAPPPSPIATGVAEFLTYAERPPALVPDLAPGRGLTGPPLPARGPPALLI